MLFNEPKLLKLTARRSSTRRLFVSVLFNEPKLLKYIEQYVELLRFAVSVLFNEPKLLKLRCPTRPVDDKRRFSALQRAEIAEMEKSPIWASFAGSFQCSSTSRNC